MELLPRSIPMPTGLRSRCNQVKTATCDPRRLTDVSVYREVALEFSIGDRIQFSAPESLSAVSGAPVTQQGVSAHSQRALLIQRLEGSRPHGRLCTLWKAMYFESV
jgi:hypothetical protein